MALLVSRLYFFRRGSSGLGRRCVRGRRGRCCVIGLFNLTLSMDFVEIWNYFHADIDRFCHSECGTLYNTSDDYGARCNTTCLAVEDAITKLALNYDSLPASDIAFNLRISGLMAMYSFCAAVIISLSTGAPPPPFPGPRRARARG
eukprot:886160-Prymnesium_polylepis.1